MGAISESGEKVTETIYDVVQDAISKALKRLEISKINERTFAHENQIEALVHYDDDGKGSYDVTPLRGYDIDVVESALKSEDIPFFTIKDANTGQYLCVSRDCDRNKITEIMSDYDKAQGTFLREALPSEVYESAMRNQNGVVEINGFTDMEMEYLRQRNWRLKNMHGENARGGIVAAFESGEEENTNTLITFDKNLFKERGPKGKFVGNDCVFDAIVETSVRMSGPDKDLYEFKLKSDREFYEKKLPEALQASYNEPQYIIDVAGCDMYAVIDKGNVSFYNGINFSDASHLVKEIKYDDPNFTGLLGYELNSIGLKAVVQDFDTISAYTHGFNDNSDLIAARPREGASEKEKEGYKEKIQKMQENKSQAFDDYVKYLAGTNNIYENNAETVRRFKSYVGSTEKAYCTILSESAQKQYVLDYGREPAGYSDAKAVADIMKSYLANPKQYKDNELFAALGANRFKRINMDNIKAGVERASEKIANVSEIDEVKQKYITNKRNQELMEGRNPATLIDKKLEQAQKMAEILNARAHEKDYSRGHETHEIERGDK